MSKKLYEEANIQDIADAIREKNERSDSYTVSQMGDAIRAIHTRPDLQVLNATENGTYLPRAGKDGFSEVNINVPKDMVLQELVVNSNGVITPAAGYDGIGKITVAVGDGRCPRSEANSLYSGLVDEMSWSVSITAEQLV